ncbi:MAG: sigma-70 family RNA polymerase sigma factor [Gemmatimonadaceae bacterium]
MRRRTESLATNVARDRDAYAASGRAGDAPELDALFRTYGDTLRRFAYRFVRSRDAAAEIVQDVFCNVWRTREQFALRQEPLAYLFTATRNRALDVRAHEGVRRRWYEEWSVEQLHPGTRRHAAPPDEVTHLADLQAAIDDALARMPGRRQLVCRLRWKDGLSPREIAAQLQVALKTVETQISRGLRDLRQRLNGHLDKG